MSTSDTPETQPSSSARMYDSRAPTYDDSWHPAFARLIASHAALQPGQSILDLACGTGLVTIPAAHAVGPTGHVVGVDISAGMLDIAREKVRDEKLTNVQLFQHDITRVDELEGLRGRKFDAITMASALVLLTDGDRARAGKVWAGMLREGGVVVVDVPTPGNQVEGLILERAMGVLGMKGRVPYSREWVKDEGSLRSWLEEAGLVVESVVEVEQTGEGTAYLDVAEADHGLQVLAAHDVGHLVAVELRVGDLRREEITADLVEEGSHANVCVCLR